MMIKIEIKLFLDIYYSLKKRVIMNAPGGREMF